MRLQAARARNRPPDHVSSWFFALYIGSRGDLTSFDETFEEHKPLRELIQRCLDGDREAFAELVDIHQGIVLATAFSLARDRHAAEELAQETFVRAYRSLGRLEDPDRLGSWLRGICRNAWRQRCRDAARALPTVDLSGLEGGIAAIEDPGSLFDGHDPQELLPMMATELRKLSDAQQLVLTLRHFDGLACKDIARRLGVSVAAVSMRLTRGHRELRRALQRRLNRAGEIR